ncbi:MAG: hypothetical protein V2I43_21165 [Parvularcula sp.]|jgi:hypothetical protein|nr:hypothetical protein [Parvularcula sp.]
MNDAASPDARPHARNGKRLFFWVALSASPLLIPLIAMQFTDEVVWTGFDFLLAAVVLVGAGLVYAVASARASSVYGKMLYALPVLLGVMLFWAWAVN